MQYVSKVLDPERFPAITHYDGTCRIQTVNKWQHEGLYELMIKLKADGIPLVLNTSLNIKGEPLVNLGDDAYRFWEQRAIEVYGWRN